MRTGQAVGIAPRARAAGGDVRQARKPGDPPTAVPGFVQRTHDPAGAADVRRAPIGPDDVRAVGGSDAEAAVAPERQRSDRAAGKLHGDGGDAAGGNGRQSLARAHPHRGVGALHQREDHVAWQAIGGRESPGLAIAVRHHAIARRAHPHRAVGGGPQRAHHGGCQAVVGAQHRERRGAHLDKPSRVQAHPHRRLAVLVQAQDRTIRQARGGRQCLELPTGVTRDTGGAGSDPQRAAAILEQCRDRRAGQ